MRNLFAFLILLGGCVSAPADVKTIHGAISNAAKYQGLQEKEDRQELKEFLGVDPVRTEWCAAFVNAVLEESGIPGSESVSNHPLTARSFLKWGEKVDEPLPGDIVIFPRGNVSWQGHVGFYIGTIVRNDIKYYLILGGNQTNSVNIEYYRASKAIGIRRLTAHHLDLLHSPQYQ